MFRVVTASFAVLACGLASACDSADTAPATVAEAAPAVAEPAAPALGAEIVLSLTCSALSSNEGFTREVKLVGGGGVYTWTRGAKDAARYEHWELKVSGNSFAVTGEYIEGGPVLKTLAFTGAVVGTTVSGEGTRGPRKCTITT